MKVDVQQLAKELFDAFTLRLQKATGHDEAPKWSELSGQERGAFRDAVEEVVARQVEMLALEMKLDDMMDDVLLDSKPKAAPPPKRDTIALPPATACYYCGKGIAIKWYACERCLKI